LIILSSNFTLYSTALYFSKDFNSIFGKESICSSYFKSFPSPKVFKSIFGCPATLILLSSIAFADGILEIPEKVSFISKGDQYYFYSFKNIFK